MRRFDGQVLPAALPCAVRTFLQHGLSADVPAAAWLASVGIVPWGCHPSRNRVIVVGVRVRRLRDDLVTRMKIDNSDWKQILKQPD